MGAERALEHIIGDVSRETMERLHCFVALVLKWTPVINLISKSTAGTIWDRHIADSAQLLELVPGSAEKWVDLGSGGGFPGLVVAALAAERQPPLNMTLVESDVRKAAFLATAAREMGLDVTVIAERAEALAPQGADVVSARALAPLGKLLGYAERHLSPGGVAIFPKGVQFDAELPEALAAWRFDLHKTPSKTDSSATILTIRGIARA